MALTLNTSHYHFLIPRVSYPDRVLHHVRCEGARFHTLSWDSEGAHCSEPNCEINHGGIRGYMDCPADGEPKGAHEEEQ